MREWERGPAMRIDPVRPAGFKSLPFFIHAKNGLQMCKSENMYIRYDEVGG